jgi:hypothetical protein
MPELQNGTFISGNEYTLAAIFSGENRIVIPDLQRDYCWGNNVHDKVGKRIPELVSGFIDNLKEAFCDKQPDDKMTLGMIYGYEQPKGHIHLCDGQQRITTLVLLLGMLYRKIKADEFRKALVFEDKEPHLQYAIRESTLYFFNDLVSNFFLADADEEISNIKPENWITSRDWYFAEYDQDPTIQSMIAALKTIDKQLFCEMDWEAFGRFILNDLHFLYYDMGSRAHGEETFVVINTTGEPLTPTENLKPVLITRQRSDIQDMCADEWESWEEWFWQKRNGNSLADDGLNEFFRWVSFLEEEKQDPVNMGDKITGKQEALLGSEKERGILSPKEVSKIPFERIKLYFEVVQSLFDNGAFRNTPEWLSPNEKGNTFVTWFKLLPVIAFAVRFKVNDYNSRTILRVAHYFENIARVDNGRRNDISKAICLVNQLPSQDIASVLDIDKPALHLSDEEKAKFTIYRNVSSQEERVIMETRFWKAEEHEILNGQIHVLIKWATKDIFSAALFDRYYQTFRELFRNGKDTSDLVRRSLLTLRFNKWQYPFIYEGNKNHTFCSTPEQWREFITNHAEKVGVFVMNVSESAVDLNETLQRMIDEHKVPADYDTQHDIPIEFIKHADILSYCSKKIVQWGGDDVGWVLISKERASSKIAIFKTYAFYLELSNSINGKCNEWGAVWFYNEDKSSTVVIDYKQLKVAVDIVHKKTDLFELQLFARSETTENTVWQKMAAEVCDLKFDDSTKRYTSQPKGKEDTIKLLKSLIAYQPDKTEKQL